MIPQRLAFIDLETTGGNPLVDRVTEIGVVEVDGDHVSTWTSLVNPERAIPPFIQQLTGISNKMVADAPTFAQLADELAERLQGRLFIAHNARFDYGFVKHEYLRLGQRFRADVLCTVRLSRRLFPQYPRHNLDSLIVRHGLATGDRHRALADADLIWQFWRLQQQERDSDAFAEAVQHQLMRPSLPPHLDPTLLDDLPEAPGVYLFHGENDVLLYVGKSANLRQGVLTHFASDTPEYKTTRLTREVRRVHWHETVGELGALLLESRIVKDREPLHNRRVPGAAKLFGWQLEQVATGDFRPRLVSGDDVDFGRAEDVYGLFASPRIAAATLKKIADAHELCPVILGLETPTQPDGACSTHQAHKCRGACIGKEAIGLHSARLMTALAKLKVKTWAHPGAIGLVERNDFLDVEEVHVVNGWRYLGTARSDAEIHELLGQADQAQFDMNTYKMLKTQLGKGKVRVRQL